MTEECNGKVDPIRKLVESPFVDNDDITKFVEFKLLDARDIYFLLDARARDYRTILIAIMAAMVVLFVQTVNSAQGGCWIASISYILMMVFLFCIARCSIAPEVNKVITEANYIRVNYVENRNAVPMIDTLLLGSKTPWILRLFGLNRVARHDHTKVSKEEETAPYADLQR